MNKFLFLTGHNYDCRAIFVLTDRNSTQWTTNDRQSVTRILGLRKLGANLRDVSVQLQGDSVVSLVKSLGVSDVSSFDPLIQSLAQMVMYLLQTDGKLLSTFTCEIMYSIWIPGCRLGKHEDGITS